MEITVQKPTEEQIAAMRHNPVWECGVSEFDWYYDEGETCLLLAGAAEVSHAGGSVRIAAGDLVTFPQGLACVWKVTEPVKKHYQFG